jgi:hypothetical protein
MGRIRITYHRINSTGIQGIPPFSETKYNSRYGWVELLEMLNIKSLPEFINYLETVPKIKIGDPSTYLHSDAVEKVTPIPVLKPPKTISGLPVKIEYNKIQIGSAVFSKTDILGIKKKLDPIKFNSKEYELNGYILIDSKKVTKKQINNLTKFI